MSSRWMWIVAVVVMVGQCRAGDRILRTEAVVHAPVSEVWKAFTSKEGVQAWMVPVAEVDLRLGGTLKTNYNPQAKIGDPGTIVHHILSYEPERMLTTRFTAPETAPDWAKVAQATWAVYRFEPISPQETRVTVTMLGWGTGAAWEESYDHFRRGNEWELQQLVKHFFPQMSEPELMKGKEKTAHSAELEKKVICAPAATFKLWTTEEGLRKFFSEGAHVDPWPGGRYEIIFNPKVDPEAKSYGTGGARVLRFVPDKELAFEWVAFTLDDGTPHVAGPPQMPAAVRNQRPLPTWVELHFQPAQAGGTDVQLGYYGSREGGKWDESFAYFQKAWAKVLGNLEQYCAETAGAAVPHE
ncbi:MAG TPA: SRPBCC domain-containing protein [Terriglobales bacterium]|nr:SRPBCC domain-containing protein [Terriglobales bacterium]